MNANALVLKPTNRVGSFATLAEPPALNGGARFAADMDAGFECHFAPGALAPYAWLTADFLADGPDTTKVLLHLIEGDNGPVFYFVFCILPLCQARMRMPLGGVNQSRLALSREGAWLKPRFRGQRVDLGRVDRLRLTVIGKGEEPARFCMTPLTASSAEPAPLTNPLLPAGPLLDEFGQSATRQWAGKSRSRAEITDRLVRQSAAADLPLPVGPRSRWGGWREHQVAASGFFRTHHDGARWWLVDPDGCLFWSSGMNCVRPEVNANAQAIERALPPGTPLRDGNVDFLQRNFIQAFGADPWRAHWLRIAAHQLRELGFNTMGNWSQWQDFRGANLPYAFELNVYGKKETPAVFRDFPDVFDPRFPVDADALAEQLRPTRDDPALLGYFLMNEPLWAFASLCLVEGMLSNTEACVTRTVFRRFLQQRYAQEAQLAAAWNMPATFDRIERGRWTGQFTPAALRDLEAFSTIMVTRYFTTLLDACRRVDPHHINLGARIHTVPPPWALEGMKGFDVFSINCYRERVPMDWASVAVTTGAPLLIGEWHFGALDAGLPASGIQRVRNQAARGVAFRGYLEQAAALPWCVGAHWFELYDQSALGRFDGECTNIGFFDVCHRRYEDLAAAARASHDRLDGVARGAVAPFVADVEFLKGLY